MQKQQGMTFIGMLMTVAVVVMVGIVVMRIVPVYLQHYSIVQSIKALNSTSKSTLTGDPMSDATALRASITKRLDINSLQDLKPNELTITPVEGGEKYLFKLDYQVIRPLVYNISLMFDFKDTIEVKPGSE